MRVTRANVPVMQFDCPAGNRKAKSHPSAGATAIRLNTVEGIEDPRQGLLRNTRAVVPDLDDMRADPDG